MRMRQLMQEVVMVTLGLRGKRGHLGACLMGVFVVRGEVSAVHTFDLR
jgi:hypothetical protein